MPFVEFFLLRLVVWLGLLSALVALAVGPRRLWRGMKRTWTVAFRKRLDPEEILTQVVDQHQQHVKAVRAALGQAEQAEAAIREHLRQSEQHVTVLAAEATRLAQAGDELGARAALYKINLERSAIENFGEQLTRQCGMVAESRHRLYLLELQLRQYEVGRSILLSQLAQAEKVEEQYAIARGFDPFNAVANWQKAEGLVQEKSLNARAIERVYADTSELAAAGPPVTIDPVVLEAQLVALRAQLKKANQINNGTPAGNNAAKIAGETAVGKHERPGEPPHANEKDPPNPEKSP
jgi:phage shock protein A